MFAYLTVHLGMQPVMSCSFSHLACRAAVRASLYFPISSLLLHGSKTLLGLGLNQSRCQPASLATQVRMQVRKL